MSITSGIVELDLDGQVLELKPTLDAMLKINRRFGSFQGALLAVQKLDFDALVFIIAVGANKSPPSKDLQRQIFACGLEALAEPLARYLELLSNGGRERDDTSGGDAGNG